MAQRTLEKLADKIISYRKKNYINLPEDLLNLFSGCFYVPKKNQFFARIFRAIRIEVNDELNSLKDFLSIFGNFLCIIFNISLYILNSSKGTFLGLFIKSIDSYIFRGILVLNIIEFCHIIFLFICE